MSVNKEKWDIEKKFRLGIRTNKKKYAIFGNHMVMTLSLSFLASLEDLEDHKEKRLKYDLEPEINRNGHTKITSRF